MKRAIKAALFVFLAAVIVFPSFAGVFVGKDNAASLEAQAASGNWVGAWATAPISATVSVGSSLALQDMILARSTTRTELTITTGGTLLRIMVSNLYGEGKLTISEASVAKTNTDIAAAILENTSVGLTFGGKQSVTLDVGEELWSDPVYYVTQPLDRLSVSFYYASRSTMSTCGLFGGTTYLSTAPTSALFGNASQVNSLTMNNPGEVSIGSSTITYHTIPFLTNVDVYSPSINAYTTVIIGDSTLTNNNHLFLATKLVNAGYTDIGFINQSIVANRLLYDGVGLIGNLYGKAFVDRFERDALNQSNVKTILVKIGLNDCLHPATKSMAGKAPYASVDDIINGYKELVRMAHARGIKIYFFKMTAWKGYQRSFLGQSDDLSWSQGLQDMCDALDNWVVTTPIIDGYIDLDKLDDPLDNTALLPAFTSDGAHLTDLGAIYCADLIPLSIFGIRRNLPTAASIIGLDPEQAKQDRIDAANAAEQTTEAPVTQATPEVTTVPQEPSTDEEPATKAPATKPVQPVTVAPQTEAPVSDNVQTTAAAESTDIAAPVVDATVQPVQDTTAEAPVVPSAGDPSNQVSAVNNGAKIGLVLVIVLVLVVVGAIVILSLGKKKVEGEI